MKNYRKMSKLASILVLSIALAGCSNSLTSLTGGVEASVIGAGSGKGSLASREKQVFNKEVINRVQVTTEAMQIYITSTNNESAEVELLVDDSVKQNFAFNAAVESGLLVVDVKEGPQAPNFDVMNQQGERKLIISLPAKSYEQIVVKNGFGRVEAAGLQAAELDVAVEAGSIQLDNVSAELVLRTNAGDIEAKGIRLNQPITAKSEVGQINIQLAEEPASVEIELKSEVGNVSADIPGLNLSTDTYTEKQGVVGANGMKLKATTNVGSVTVGVEA